MAKYSNNSQKTTNSIDIISITKDNVAESLRKHLLNTLLFLRSNYIAYVPIYLS